MRSIHLYIFLVQFIWVHSLAALTLGARYEPETDRTVFKVFAASAKKVELVLYSSEKGTIDFSRQMDKISDVETNTLDRLVSTNTYGTQLKGDFRGHFYHYRVTGNSSLNYKKVDSRRILAQISKPVHIFLFNREYGYLELTSAPGYFDENPGVESKTESQPKVIRESVEGGTQFQLIAAKKSFEDFFVEVMPEGTFPERINDYPVMDPYCKRISTFFNRCEIVDDPVSSSQSQGKRSPSFQAGHVIHEVHLKDLTMLLPGIPNEIRGTYQAISHPHTIRALKDLHVTTLEFLPLHHYDQSAAPPGHINYWGYMTIGFFALHEPYAAVEGQARIEFKQAVEALHEADISVVMDVVYNHTSEGDHRGPNVAFKNLGRDQYFRMHDAKKGYFLNTTGVGNTCRTESAVMRKLILDSLKFFVNTYEIDGFRFDLGAAIDPETFRAIRQQLPASVLLTAEPWVAAGAGQWGRADLNELEVGKWSDRYRVATKGNDSVPGFINGEANEQLMRILVRGEAREFGGSGSYIFDQPGNTNPRGVINEVEVHDGHTLYDWLAHVGIPESHREARIRLASTLLMTSVNTPILQFGQEFGRTKQGDHNSYDKDSEINYIDWSLRKSRASLANFTTGLKKLRSRHDAFHFQSRINDDRLIFLDDKQESPQAFGYQMKGSGEKFIVLLNGSPEGGVDFQLPEGIWNVVSNGEVVAPRGLGKVTNQHYYLHPSSSAILLQKTP